MFLERSIDNAIRVTCEQIKENISVSDLESVTATFANFAAGLYTKEGFSDDYFYSVSYFSSSYEEYLAMCRQLFSDCNLSQKEDIRLIILGIVRVMKLKFLYHMSLNKGDRWGRAVLSLAEAFGVGFEEEK